ncbi:5870_t:CDS:2, partial [Racocetra fulgida]
FAPRFENLRVGTFNNVYYIDIKSCYANIMRDYPLPCGIPELVTDPQVIGQKLKEGKEGFVNFFLTRMATIKNNQIPFIPNSENQIKSPIGGRFLLHTHYCEELKKTDESQGKMLANAFYGAVGKSKFGGYNYRAWTLAVNHLAILQTYYLYRQFKPENVLAIRSDCIYVKGELPLSILKATHKYKIKKYSQVVFFGEENVFIYDTQELKARLGEVFDYALKKYMDAKYINKFTKIKKVLCAIGRSGYIHRDLQAIKNGAKQNGFIYTGNPVLPGFKKIDEPGTVISIILKLEDEQTAFGDCVDVIFTGIAGRDKIFNAENHIDYVIKEISPKLVGRQLNNFRYLAYEFDNLYDKNKKIHTAIRYGVTQALLHAVSLSLNCTMAEVISSEYKTNIANKLIPILASCNRDDFMQLDRMIIKKVDLLPHASFTDVNKHIGLKGEKLINYAKIIVNRIKEIGEKEYKPKIHLDVYGTLGELFKMDFDLISDYLGELQKTTFPYDLLIESPIIAKNQQEQILGFKKIKELLNEKGFKVSLIADEWCNTFNDIKLFTDEKVADYIQIKTPDLGGINNTIEAILYCKKNGMKVCLGGTANETDQSSRITSHIALACNPDYLLSKPGLGGDEGIMILNNEMSRTLTIVNEIKQQQQYQAQQEVPTNN